MDKKQRRYLLFGTSLFFYIRLHVFKVKDFPCFREYAPNVYANLEDTGY
ncbi:hypothetical protein M2132_000364 [Dysgonomonas sp. PH5-45]|nr:hypothetical protein [Dysgonomonas sp. PH5-45]MDH6386946.1 hypothetical protein [Dysgonomonas sp. PH5-37]